MSSQVQVFGDKTFNAIGYGGMGLSIAYGAVGTDEDRLKVRYLHFLCPCSGLLTLVRIKVLDAVYESGCTFWDTADVYGDNEELIGKWYAHLPRKTFLLFPTPLSYRFKKTGKRNEIFLATKFGSAHGDPNRIINADPEYVPVAFDQSMSKLGVDYVDLYYAHRADPTVPIEHTVGAMAKLVKWVITPHLSHKLDPSSVVELARSSTSGSVKSQLQLSAGHTQSIPSLPSRLNIPPSLWTSRMSLSDS